MYRLSPITERVQRMRARYRDTVPYVDITRYRLVTEFYMEHPELGGNIRRAMNFRNLCEKLPVVIFEDEIIAGAYVTTYRASALYPENSIDWLVTEIKNGTVYDREIDPYHIEKEDEAYILETADFWMGECANAKMNPYIPKAYQDRADNGVLFFPAQNIIPQPIGHFVPGYQKALRVGFGAVKAEAEAKMKQLEEDGFDGENAKSYRFYMGVSIVCEGIITFAKRYSAECARLAAAEADPGRKAELERMADTFGWIIENPVRDYRDALQAVWFYQMCVLMDANLHGTSVGRIDQYLGDFAEKDIAEGRLTREEAQELLDMYYLKVAECNKVWGSRHAQTSPGYTSGQQITVGGVDRDGNDASNIVTYMALESVGRLQLHDPPQALRLHEGTPKDLWDCALEVNKRAGGVPSFYSDKVIIETMEKRGIPLEDARNYCVVGCVEPGICGCDWTASGGTGVNSYMNFANIFLLAVNDGKNPQPYPDGSPRTQQFGPHTGYLYEMTDIEQVKEAFRAQMDYWIKWYVNMVNLFEDVIRDYLPQPVVSAMMGGCMEKGRDVLDGGAKYNSVGQSGIGLGNATDCLFMVDELCFKTKRCTTRELYDAVMANWEGYEELHDFIDGYEKHYGNGISEVDRYCTYVGDLYPELLSKHTGPRGCHYAAGMFPVTMNVVYGNLTYATPDGRRNGEPLSDGISAVQGHDLNGPTAILNSVTAFDHTNYSNGTLLNMKFHPLVLSGEDGFMKLEQLMSTYFFRMGGMEMQFNIVSSDTLRDAQEHPEDYKDLVVRIAGFSAYFVDVYRKAQDDLIRRSELSV